MNLQTLSWRTLPWVKATRPQWRYALRNGIAMCLALSIAYALDLDELLGDDVRGGGQLSHRRRRDQ